MQSKGVWLDNKMKLYHGSPVKLDKLVPRLAKGIGDFQNQKAIFFTKSLEQAALYAIGKSLKGKTQFALPPNKLIIVGDFKPGKGYVYEVDIDAKKGELGDYEYAYTKPISKFKFHEVNPDDYKSKIAYVKSKEEMMRLCGERRIK